MGRVLPMLETAIPRAGRASRRRLADDAAVARWRDAGCPGETLTVHRYYLPRHDLHVAATPDPSLVTVTVDHRPVGRVRLRRTRRGLFGAIDAVAAARANRAGTPSGIEVGGDELGLQLLGGLTKGSGPRRLRVTLGDRSWTLAERTSLPHTVALWRAGPDDAPVAWMRPRQQLAWGAGTTLAELVVLETIALRHSPEELEVMLRRLAGLTTERYAILAPLVETPDRTPAIRRSR